MSSASFALSSIHHNYSNQLVVQAVSQQTIQPSISLGATLDEAGAQQTIRLLNGQHVEQNNIFRIDGNTVNHYLNDGSNNNTAVYSSAIIEPREAGYGVQVQIVTPQTILNVTPQTYVNAAITAGAKDVLIRVASTQPVTGEGALSGVYKIYEVNGQELNRKNVEIAQKEIKVINEVAQSKEMTQDQINELQGLIKSEISKQLKEKGSLDETTVSQIVNQVINNYLSQHNLKLSDNMRKLLVDFAQEYAKSEVAQNESTNQQIEASTDNAWTKERAIDYFESVFFNQPYNGLRYSPEVYRASEWEELSNEESIITLKLTNGEVTKVFQLEHDGVNVIVREYEEADYPEKIAVEYKINRPSSVILHEKHYRLMDTATGFNVFDAETAEKYVAQSVASQYDDVQTESVEELSNGSYAVKLSSKEADFTNQEGLIGYYGIDPDGNITELNNYQQTIGKPYYEDAISSTVVKTKESGSESSSSETEGTTQAESEESSSESDETTQTDPVESSTESQSIEESAYDSEAEISETPTQTETTEESAEISTKEGSSEETVEETTAEESTETETSETQSEVESTEIEISESATQTENVSLSWTDSKEAELDAFVKQWAIEMNQSYDKATPEQPLNMYGVEFPTQLLELLAVNDQAYDAIWIEPGQLLEEDVYNVVAAYGEVPSEANAMRMHYYLFAIYNGEPVVLHSQQNQGMPDNRIHFTPTENVDLQSGFEAIVNK